MHSSKWAVIAGALAVVVLAAIGAVIWLQSRSAQGVDIEIKAPAEINVGVPFDIQVDISNTSDSIFENVRVDLSLPEGMVFLGEKEGVSILYKNIGSLGSGSLAREIFSAVAVSGENSVKKIEASITYSPSTLGAEFEKRTSTEVNVGEAGVFLDVAAPAKVFSGENFDIKISYRNVSEYEYEELRLIAEYPPVFNFKSSSLAPDEDNNVWKIGGLRKKSDNTFSIRGNLTGPDDALFDVVVKMEGRFRDKWYEIAKKSASIAIATSPLSLKIFVNEIQDYTAKADDFLHYTLVYRNNTDTALRDILIRTQLIGEMFDFDTLETNGAFRSLDNTILWNVSNTPDLGVLAAGASGSVDFKIRTKKNYPIIRLGDKNFVLKVKAEIESSTVPLFVEAEKTLGIAVLETKVRGDTQIDAQAFFRDASSGIINEGPFPPRLNQATQYTVHWKIKNYATDIENVEVSAFLGPNVRFTGVAKTNIGTSTPVYNEATQKIVWRIDHLPAGRGVINAPAEAIFQIEAIPSSSGDYWPLISETKIRARDSFTGELLSDTDFAISTSLPDDITVTSQAGIVRE